jgi:hypothetical protein
MMKDNRIINITKRTKRYLRNNFNSNWIIENFIKSIEHFLIYDQKTNRPKKQKYSSNIINDLIKKSQKTIKITNLRNTDKLLDNIYSNLKTIVK